MTPTLNPDEVRRYTAALGFVPLPPQPKQPRPEPTRRYGRRMGRTSDTAELSRAHKTQVLPETTAKERPNSERGFLRGPKSKVVHVFAGVWRCHMPVSRCGLHFTEGDFCEGASGGWVRCKRCEGVGKGKL